MCFLFKSMLLICCPWFCSLGSVHPCASQHREVCLLLFFSSPSLEHWLELKCVCVCPPGDWGNIMLYVVCSTFSLLFTCSWTTLLLLPPAFVSSTTGNMGLYKSPSNTVFTSDTCGILKQYGWPTFTFLEKPSYCFLNCILTSGAQG